MASISVIRSTVVVVASVVVEVVGSEVGVVAGVDEEHPTTTNDTATKHTHRMPPPYGTNPPLQESRQTCFSRPSPSVVRV